jgi:immune inhibitor A
MDNPLHRAVELAKAGRKDEAMPIVAALIRQNPNDAQAWLVMAQLVDDPQQAADCMRHVVELRPDDPKMQNLLARLEARAQAAQPPPEPEPKTWQPPVQPEPEAWQPPTQPEPEAWQPPTQPEPETWQPPAREAEEPAEETPGQRNLAYWVIGAVGLLVIAACVVGVVLLRPNLSAIPMLSSGPPANAPIEAAPGEVEAPSERPTPTAFPTPTPTPLPTADPVLLETVALLSGVDFHPVDLVDLLERTSILEEPVERTRTSTPSYRVGDVETFYVATYTFFGGFQYLKTRATLAYMNDVVAMWVEYGYPVDKQKLAAAADTFALEIYPTVREVFGEEWSPGIDNDPRLHIVNMFWLGPNVGGYFSPADEYPSEVYPFSNEREAFYISMLGLEVGSDEYMSTLAHEFQHMVRWNNDPNEDLWLNEGLSQLAERIAGYDTAFTHFNYLYDSQVQLNSWSEDFRESYSHYGAAYLFSLYLWERLGTDVIYRIADHPAGGMAAVEDVLAGEGIAVDDIFADWIVANYLDDPTVGDGRYGYEYETLTPICPRRRVAATKAQPRTSLAQYTANYIEIEGQGEFTIDFRGDTEVPLIPTSPKSGRHFFWAGRADNSDMTLTRAFDLRGLESATLQYWTWYDIQELGDFGFVLASTDGGETWDFLNATSMQVGDEWFDEGLSFYTGASGGGQLSSSWLWEEVDLSPYVGGEVLIRFEYVTNTTYNGLGWAIENIRIPELDYYYDVDTADESWEMDGFIRANNQILQKWVLYLIEYGNGTTVTPIPVFADGTADATVTLGPESDRATVVVGAMAPLTKVEANYHLAVGGSGQLASLQYPPRVLYQDDFESPCGSFISFILPDYSYGYKNGRYEIEIGLEEVGIWGLAQQEFRDVAVEVDATFVEPKADTAMGIMCRVEDDYNYYSFEIRNDGTYTIYGVDDDYYVELQDWTESGAINTGAGATNHLKAICNGDTLTLFINGDRVADVTVPQVSRGDIGFIAWTFKEPGILVAFDDLVASRP